VGDVAAHGGVVGRLVAADAQVAVDAEHLGPAAVGGDPAELRGGRVQQRDKRRLDPLLEQLLVAVEERLGVVLLELLEEGEPVVEHAGEAGHGAPLDLTYRVRPSRRSTNWR
jgi:hypothetical protein